MLIRFLAAKTQWDATLVRFAVAVLRPGLGVTRTTFMRKTVQRAYGSYVAAQTGAADVRSAVRGAWKSSAITVSYFTLRILITAMSSSGIPLIGEALRGGHAGAIVFLTSDYRRIAAAFTPGA
ncbi:hypothetical protein CHU98_g2399 [Xylaria longipes]|nr:hypothetical protein CHU98_g2399 [Xylaria longipes]